MKKVLLFISSEKGYTALKQVVNANPEWVGCVISFREVNVDHDWSVDIEKTCSIYRIPFYMWRDAKSKLVSLIHQYSITSAFTVSWKYLLPLEINNYLEDKLIVFHDSLLPKYRGFAPTPTAIICGENVIGVTAIYATDKVDEGDIILQKKVNVDENMYIDEIIRLQSSLCGEMLVEIIAGLSPKTIFASPQNHSNATYSIWRSEEDCHINWEKSSEYIFNFVRAVNSPYPGAFTFYNEQKIIIRRAINLNYDLRFAIRESGKIWSIENGEPIIICGSGLLKIVKAVDQNENEVVFNKVRIRLK